MQPNGYLCRPVAKHMTCPRRLMMRACADLPGAMAWQGSERAGAGWSVVKAAGSIGVLHRSSRIRRRFSPKRVLGRKLVADCRGSDTSFAHRVADLVEPLDHVACRIEPRHAGALVRIDF